jgi:hypothetical protein
LAAREGSISVARGSRSAPPAITTPRSKSIAMGAAGAGATIAAYCDVRLSPKSGGYSGHRALSEKGHEPTRLFDHRVGTGDQPCGYFEAKLLRRLEVDDQLPMGFLKIRHLCWVTAVENFNDLRGKASRRFMFPGVRHKRTALDRFCISGEGGKMILLCKSPQQVTMRVILERRADHHAVNVISLHCLKSPSALSLINLSLQGLQLQRNLRLLSGWRRRHLRLNLSMHYVSDLTPHSEKHWE